VIHSKKRCWTVLFEGVLWHEGFCLSILRVCVSPGRLFTKLRNSPWSNGSFMQTNSCKHTSYGSNCLLFPSLSPVQRSFFLPTGVTILTKWKWAVCCHSWYELMSFFAINYSKIFSRKDYTLSRSCSLWSRSGIAYRITRSWSSKIGSKGNAQVQYP